MVSCDLKHNLFPAIHICRIVMVSGAVVCKTGIYILRTYLCGRTFLKNYLCSRTELYQKFVQTFPFCMTSLQNMEAIFRCKCFHLLQHILNWYKKNFEKYFTAKQNATLDANSWTLHPFTYAEAPAEIFSEGLGQATYPLFTGSNKILQLQPEFS